MQQLIELTTIDEMMEQFSLIQQLYPDYSTEKYQDLLRTQKKDGRKILIPILNIKT